MTTRELVERVSLELDDDDYDFDDESTFDEVTEDELMQIVSGIGGRGSVLVH